MLLLPTKIVCLFLFNLQFIKADLQHYSSKTVLNFVKRMSNRTDFDDRCTDSLKKVMHLQLYSSAISMKQKCTFEQ